MWPKRKKRKHEMGRESAETKVGASKKVKEVVVRGGNRKLKLLAADVANVIDPEGGETKRTKILSVLENPANLHFVRRNIITKGAVIETELGKVRVTSRPGQTGTVDGILLEAKKVEEQKTERPSAKGPSQPEEEKLSEEKETESPDKS